MALGGDPLCAPFTLLICVTGGLCYSSPPLLSAAEVGPHPYRHLGHPEAHWEVAITRSRQMPLASHQRSQKHIEGRVVNCTVFSHILAYFHKSARRSISNSWSWNLKGSRQAESGREASIDMEASELLLSGLYYTVVYRFAGIRRHNYTYLNSTAIALTCHGTSKGRPPVGRNSSRGGFQMTASYPFCLICYASDASRENYRTD